MHASWVAVPLALFLTAAAAHAAQDTAPAMRPVPPLPTIGLSLPRIGLPQPVSAETKAPDDNGATTPRQRSGRDRGTATGRQGADGRQPQGQQPWVVFVPVFTVDPATTAGNRSEATVQRAPGARPANAGTDATGTLAFDLQPSMTADVFVDGSYAGTTEIVGEGLEITAGRHVVELLADGFEMRRFEAQIAAGRTVTFRGSLTKHVEVATPEPAVAMAPATPTTFYVVPGCYAGNVPPQQALLPAGCDAALARTFTR